MYALQTAIIQHTTDHGVHHDWLIEDPRLDHPVAPDARLWTARVTPCPSKWVLLGRFDAQVLAPHRRAYLDYQGAVSGDRGRVQQITKGTAVPQLWTASRIVLELQTSRLSASIELRRLGNDRWMGMCHAI